MGNWLEKFWWTRGVLAAMSLAALLPEFIDLSRYELLRATHAMLLYWNNFATLIGKYMSYLPFIPEVSTVTVNALIYTTSFVLPVIIGDSMHDIKYYTKLWRKMLSIKTYESLFHMISVSIIHIGSIFASLIVLYFPFGYIFLEDSRDLFYIPEWELILVVVVLAGLCILPTYRAFKSLPGYFRGAFTVITFMVCLEVLYLAQTPLVTGAINKFTCNQIEGAYQDCSSTSTSKKLSGE